MIKLNARQVYDALNSKREYDWSETIIAYMDEKGVLDFIVDWYMDKSVLEDTFSNTVKEVCVKTVLEYHNLKLDDYEKYMNNASMVRYLNSYIYGTPKILHEIKEVHSTYIQYYKKKNVRFK